MSTQISTSVITDDDVPSDSFTATSDFLVVCSKGLVMVEIQIGGAWYKVSALDERFASDAVINAGSAARVTLAESGATYRLNPIGVTTASAWTLT